MGIQSNVTDLIDRTYEAALDSSCWDTFLHEYMELLDADCACLMHVNEGQSELSTVHEISYDTEWVDAYENYYVKIDPRLESGRRLRNTHPILTDNILSGYFDYRKGAFYNEYSLAQDRPHFIGFGHVRSSDGWFTTLSAHRTKTQGAFDLDEVNLHHIMKPHIGRALQIHEHLYGLSERGRELEAMLDSVRFGVMLLNRDGHLEYTNTYASDILKAQDGLTDAYGHLKALSTSDSSALWILVSDVLAGGPGGAMPIRRGLSRCPLNVLVAPIRHAQDFANSKGARVMIFIRDPEESPAYSSSVLRSLFDFTKSESRIANELIDGRSVMEIASSFNIAEDTVRKAVGSMFQKTSTNRQGELIATILSSIPPGPLSV